MTEETQPALQVGSAAKWFEELNPGDEWVTAGRTITESDLLMFAGLTGDFNPVHTDEEFARKSVFGGRILHGPAGFAYAIGLVSRLGIKEGTAAGFLGMTWEFRAPIRIGDTVHVRQGVSSKRDTRNPKQGIVNFWVRMLNQRDEVVQEGEWKIMMLRRHPRTSSA